MARPRMSRFVDPVPPASPSRWCRLVSEMEPAPGSSSSRPSWKAARFRDAEAVESPRRMAGIRTWPDRLPPLPEGRGLEPPRHRIRSDAGLHEGLELRIATGPTRALGLKAMHPRSRSPPHRESRFIGLGWQRHRDARQEYEPLHASLSRRSPRQNSSTKSSRYESPPRSRFGGRGKGAHMQPPSEQGHGRRVDVPNPAPVSGLFEPLNKRPMNGERRWRIVLGQDALRRYAARRVQQRRASSSGYGPTSRIGAPVHPSARHRPAALGDSGQGAVSGRGGAASIRSSLVPKRLNSAACRPPLGDDRRRHGGPHREEALARSLDDLLVGHAESRHGGSFTPRDSGSESGTHSQ